MTNWPLPGLRSLISLGFLHGSSGFTETPPYKALLGQARSRSWFQSVTWAQRPASQAVSCREWASSSPGPSTAHLPRQGRSLLSPCGPTVGAASPRLSPERVLAAPAVGLASQAACGPGAGRWPRPVSPSPVGGQAGSPCSDVDA